MTGEVRAAGAVKILSPVADLLGGVTPDGMVCGIDGVCEPADGSSAGSPSTGPSSSGPSSTGPSSTASLSTGSSSTGAQN